MRLVLLIASIALLSTGAWAMQSAIAIAKTVSQPQPPNMPATRTASVERSQMSSDLKLTFTPARRNDPRGQIAAQEF